MGDSEIKKGRANKLDKKNVKPMPISAKPEVSDLIGQRLRSYYNEVADQPVPDRFVELLSQLEAATNSKKST